MFFKLVCYIFSTHFRAHGLPYRAALAELIARRAKKLLKLGSGISRHQSALSGPGAASIDLHSPQKQQQGLVNGATKENAMPKEVEGSPLRPFEDMTGGAYTASKHKTAQQADVEQQFTWSSLHRHVTAAAHEENDEGYNVRKISAWLRDSVDVSSRNHDVGAELCCITWKGHAPRHICLAAPKFGVDKIGKAAQKQPYGGDHGEQIAGRHG